MNKENAHLYLPLVQALADGKVLQYAENPDREGSWSDSGEVHLGHPPERYRIKPLSFPPKPDGMEWHNPDGLTAEQVGDGWRLLATSELDGKIYPHTFYWSRGLRRWLQCGSEGNYYCKHTPADTLRVPISTPYPDGSKIVDGKLVKPWVPKFKVGDRVRERLTGVICKISTIREDYQAYETTNSGVPIDEYHLEPAPWFISRHLPGFRPLHDGEEWHRQDWTEEMLVGGWRPHLVGEADYIGDEKLMGPEWYPCGNASAGTNAQNWHRRTRRALPEPAPLPEPEKHVPLGPEDVTWGSVLRWKIDLQHEALMNGKSPAGIWIGSASVALSWSELMEECEIHRPGNLDATGKPIFVPCHKPA